MLRVDCWGSSRCPCINTDKCVSYRFVRRFLDSLNKPSSPVSPPWRLGEVTLPCNLLLCEKVLQHLNCKSFWSMLPLHWMSQGCLNESPQVSFILLWRRLASFGIPLLSGFWSVPGASLSTLHMENQNICLLLLGLTFLALQRSCEVHTHVLERANNLSTKVQRSGSGWRTVWLFSEHLTYVAVTYHLFTKVRSPGIHYSSLNVAIVLVTPKRCIWMWTCWISFRVNFISSR